MMTTTTEREKRVAFGPSSEVDAPEMYKLCKSQCEALWYTKEELIRMRAYVRMIVRRKELDESQDTRRGLENMLNKGLSAFRRQVVRSILDAQAKQKLNMETTSQDASSSLASLSMELNRDSSNRAVMLAARDGAEARFIYQESSMMTNKAKISHCYAIPTAREPPTVHRFPNAAAARTA